PCGFLSRSPGRAACVWRCPPQSCCIPSSAAQTELRTSDTAGRPDSESQGRFLRFWSYVNLPPVLVHLIIHTGVITAVFQKILHSFGRVGPRVSLANTRNREHIATPGKRR